MSMPYPPAIGLLSAIVVLVVLSRWKRGRIPMPPGPSKLPLIGNMYDLPAEGDLHPWKSHLEKYGPISSVSVLNCNIVLLNNLQSCNDVLNKRSAIYAGRPVFPFASEIIGWDQQMIMAQVGEHFNTMRKLLKVYMGTPASLQKLHPTQILEARIFLGRVLERPENALTNLRVTAGAIALKMSHGYHIKADHDPLVELVERAAREFYIATRPGAWLVDIMPSINYLPDWFPGVKRYRKVGTIFRKHNMEQSDRPYNFVKNFCNGNGTFIPSFTSTMLENGVTRDTENAIKFAATAVYGGGSDPTTATLHTFILLMALYPDVQTRVQDELDKVTACERFPSFSDRAQLLYIDAVIKEVMRWHTVARICIPHRCLEDDVYNGYIIPKDAIVIANLWNISHDAGLYSNPDSFNPSRFLAEEGNVAELDPGSYMYGFGRRACPGRDFSGEFLFIMVSMILSAFRIEKKKDGKDADINPDCEFVGGTTCYPIAFPFSIIPRSENWLALIKTIYDDPEYHRSDDSIKL